MARFFKGVPIFRLRYVRIGDRHYSIYRGIALDTSFIEPRKVRMRRMRVRCDPHEFVGEIYPFYIRSFLHCNLFWIETRVGVLDDRDGTVRGWGRRLLTQIFCTLVGNIESDDCNHKKYRGNENGIPSINHAIHITTRIKEGRVLPLVSLRITQPFSYENRLHL